jgi:hypothetical protein
MKYYNGAIRHHGRFVRTEILMEPIQNILCARSGLHCRRSASRPMQLNISIRLIEIFYLL